MGLRSLLLVLSMIAVPAIGQQTATSTTTSTAPQAKPEKKICHRLVETGSLVPSKPDCRTRAQWEADAIAGQSEARYLVEKSRAGTGPQ